MPAFPRADPNRATFPERLTNNTARWRRWRAQVDRNRESTARQYDLVNIALSVLDEHPALPCGLAVVRAIGHDFVLLLGLPPMMCLVRSR